MVRGTLIGAALAAATTLAAMATASAHSGEIVKAEIRPLGGGGYRVAVTIRHGDTGWRHYINGFTVQGPGGATLNHRVLIHPHVDEQPFTRSSSRFTVPAGVKSVVIRITHLFQASASAPKETTTLPVKLRVALPDRR